MTSFSPPLSFRYRRLCIAGVVWFLAASCHLYADPPVILLDPGHGGASISGSRSARSDSSPNNATSPSGLKEKDLTLEFTKILHDEILQEANRQGVVLGVLLTRQADENPDFAARALTCNRPDTACVVSIHFNASGTAGASASGSLAMIAARGKNAKEYEIDLAFAEGLAVACSEGVRKILPSSKNRRVMSDGHLHGGLGSNFFYQLRRQPHLVDKPKCFLEVEFIDNPVVEKALLLRDRTEKFRTIAQSIAVYLVTAVK